MLQRAPFNTNEKSKKKNEKFFKNNSNNLKNTWKRINIRSSIAIKTSSASNIHADPLRCSSN